MKITVNANDFCPDDCKMCEVEKETIWFGDSTMAIRNCKWANFCRYIYELKGKNAEAEETEQ